MKKIGTIISIVVGLFAITGAIWTVDSTYTRARDFCILESKFDYSQLSQRARDLQRRMWDLQGHYGEEKAKSLQEFKELKQEREFVLEKMRKINAK